MPQPDRSLVVVRSMAHLPRHLHGGFDIDVVLVDGDGAIDAPDDSYHRVVVVAGDDSPTTLSDLVNRAAVFGNVLVAIDRVADADSAAWQEAFDGWDVDGSDRTFGAVRITRGTRSTAGPFLHGWVSAGLAGAADRTVVEPEMSKTAADGSGVASKLASAAVAPRRSRRLALLLRARRRWLMLASVGVGISVLVIGGVLGAVAGDVYLALLGTAVLLMVAAVAVRAELLSRRLLGGNKAVATRMKRLSEAVSPDAFDELRQAMRALELSNYEVVHRLGDLGTEGEHADGLSSLPAERPS